MAIGASISMRIDTPGLPPITMTGFSLGWGGGYCQLALGRSMVSAMAFWHGREFSAWVMLRHAHQFSPPAAPVSSPVSSAGRRREGIGRWRRRRHHRVGRRLVLGLGLGEMATADQAEQHGRCGDEHKITAHGIPAFPDKQILPRMTHGPGVPQPKRPSAAACKEGRGRGKTVPCPIPLCPAPGWSGKQVLRFPGKSREVPCDP